MGKLRDLTGQVFGRLTVTNQWRHQPVGKRHCIFCLCRCSCGSPRKWIRSQDLVNGRTTSCGCVHRELLVDRTLKHGHARAKQRSKTYASWERMWNRTTSQKPHNSHRYIGRGIAVEEPRWKDFTEFLKDMGECPPGKTLHRKNNDAGYAPQNCRWATPTTQSRNKSNVKLTFGAAVLIALRRLRGESRQTIAAAYNIQPKMVWRIVAGESWKGAATQARRQFDRAQRRQNDYY
jgi:hypothetical protein